MHCSIFIGRDAEGYGEAAVENVLVKSEQSVEEDIDAAV